MEANEKPSLNIFNLRWLNWTKKEKVKCLKWIIVKLGMQGALKDGGVGIEPKICWVAREEPLGPNMVKLKSFESQIK